MTESVQRSAYAASNDELLATSLKQLDELHKNGASFTGKRGSGKKYAGVTAEIETNINLSAHLSKDYGGKDAKKELAYLLTENTKHRDRSFNGLVASLKRNGHLDSSAIDAATGAIKIDLLGQNEYFQTKKGQEMLIGLGNKNLSEKSSLRQQAMEAAKADGVEEDAQRSLSLGQRLGNFGQSIADSVETGRSRVAWTMATIGLSGAIIVSSFGGVQPAEAGGQTGTPEPTHQTTPTKAPTSAPTKAPTSTSVPTKEATNTPYPTKVPTATSMPTQENTKAPYPTKTPTMVPATSTPEATKTPYPTKTPTSAPTSTPTEAATSTATATATPKASETPTNVPTATSTPKSEITVPNLPNCQPDLFPTSGMNKIASFGPGTPHHILGDNGRDHIGADNVFQDSAGNNYLQCFKPTIPPENPGSPCIQTDFFDVSKLNSDDRNKFASKIQSMYGVTPTLVSGSEFGLPESALEAFNKNFNCEAPTPTPTATNTPNPTETPTPMPTATQQPAGTPTSVPIQFPGITPCSPFMSADQLSANGCEVVVNQFTSSQLHSNFQVTEETQQFFVGPNGEKPVEWAQMGIDEFGKRIDSRDAVFKFKGEVQQVLCPPDNHGVETIFTDATGLNPGKRNFVLQPGNGSTLVFSANKPENLNLPWDTAVATLIDLGPNSAFCVEQPTPTPTNTPVPTFTPTATATPEFTATPTPIPTETPVPPTPTATPVPPTATPAPSGGGGGGGGGGGHHEATPTPNTAVPTFETCIPNESLDNFYAQLQQYGIISVPVHNPPSSQEFFAGMSQSDMNALANQLNSNPAFVAANCAPHPVAPTPPPPAPVATPTPEAPPPPPTPTEAPPPPPAPPIETPPSEQTVPVSPSGQMVPGAPASEDEENYNEDDYVVVSGDNLSLIARSHGTDLNHILIWNPSLQSHPNMIHPNDRIRLHD